MNLRSTESRYCQATVVASHLFSVSDQLSPGGIIKEAILRNTFFNSIRNGYLEIIPKEFPSFFFRGIGEYFLALVLLIICMKQ